MDALGYVKVEKEALDDLNLNLMRTKIKKGKEIDENDGPWN
jgi:hypothetical protein